MSILEKLIEPKMQIDESKKRFSNHDLIQLIIPIIIEQFLALLVGIADTMMISYAGEAAVAGVSLINQINTVLIFIFTAIASGGAIVSSQYIGSENWKMGNLSASQLIMITTLISLGLTAFILFFGSAIFLMLFGRSLSMWDDLFKNYSDVFSIFSFI